jgi:hypothetical protein
MTTPADIFETLAQLPDRTPAQRAADERSAAILRAADALYDRWLRCSRGCCEEAS